jgi:hypothetical protein
VFVDRVCKVLAKEIFGWTRALGIAPGGVTEVIQVGVVEAPIPS